MKFNFDITYLNLPGELFTVCSPVPVSQPQLVAFNDNLATELGLNAGNINTNELAEIFSGNKLPEDSASIAQAYSGHQFGYFNRLGDGRALLMGEQITPDGRRFDLQLKGSGPTPYSRRGDGRATLSAMLREYLISEAMHALGIPTTRSLAVVVTGEPVYREQVQPGAVLTRVAESHIRVGTFEHISQFSSVETLKVFTDYVIKRHYPELLQTENSALLLLIKVMEKQIDLIVNWMRVGFIHGVMNTDNMAVSGETIDYGPCAFMNAYKPETVFSSIDTSGRYAFGNQPEMALWNLTRLAESLLLLIDTDIKKAIAKAAEVLNSFQNLFEQKYHKMLAAKIGFEYTDESDILLVNNLLGWMYEHNADYTNTFVRLMYPAIIQDKIYLDKAFLKWENDWKLRLQQKGITEEAALKLMQETNPVYIPRNHKVEEVLAQVTETGKMSDFQKLNNLLSTPYATSDFDAAFMQAPAVADELVYKTYCGT
ncbi:MAG: YdiU family protein [Paludibacteraceae bacterium]|nr:YdiU family protein [Paludibacteraceae bacterium]